MDVSTSSSEDCCKEEDGHSYGDASMLAMGIKYEGGRWLPFPDDDNSLVEKEFCNP